MGGIFPVKLGAYLQTLLKWHARCHKNGEKTSLGLSRFAAIKGLAQ